VCKKTGSLRQGKENRPAVIKFDCIRNIKRLGEKSSSLFYLIMDNPVIHPPDKEEK
jgi:hypothetical protein